MKISLKLRYRLNLWLDFHQSSTAVPLGQSKKLTMFWVTWIPFSRSIANFQILILLLKLRYFLDKCMGNPHT